MKTYITQPDDSFAGIAKKFQIKDEFYLKTYHNLNCSQENLIHGKIPARTRIMIPEDPQFMNEELSSDADFDDSNISPENGFDDQSENIKEEYLTDEKKENDTTGGKTEEEQESTPSDHDGKYFVIQKGMCQCNQGF